MILAADDLRNLADRLERLDAYAAMGLIGRTDTGTELFPGSGGNPVVLASVELAFAGELLSDEDVVDTVTASYDRDMQAFVVAVVGSGARVSLASAQPMDDQPALGLCDNPYCCGPDA